MIRAPCNANMATSVSGAIAGTKWANFPDCQRQPDAPRASSRLSAVGIWTNPSFKCGNPAFRRGSRAAHALPLYKSPRGPLKTNEVGHVAKSVARWVWEKYGADVPPLVREARALRSASASEHDKRNARGSAIVRG